MSNCPLPLYWTIAHYYAKTKIKKKDAESP
jgi:hypothetical protein